MHIDLVRSPEQLDEVLSAIPDKMSLSLGVVDGRNIWKNDFTKSLAFIQRAENKIGTERIMIAPSCSLIHTPCDLDLETNDGSALQNVDYVKVRVQLTIPPGQTAIEVPIALLKNKRCRTSDMHRWQQHAHFEFHVRITAMSNANMLQPAAVIVLKKDVDDDHCSAAPAPAAN